MAEVTIPPIIGVAIRFITSAPACVAGDHMIGSRPNRMAQTVMTFGRIRWTAPSMTASCRSLEIIHPAFGAEFFPGLIEVQKHDDPGLGVEPGEGDDADPDRNAHVVA